MNQQTVEDRLRQFPGAGEIEVVTDRGRLIATVVAEKWNGVEESERQAEIWTFLTDQFGDDVYKRVEFIFTNAPDDPTD